MWIDVPQSTPEWFAMRAGKVTGSAMAKIMANYGKAFWEPAKAFAVEIACIELGGEPEIDNYSNGHMERGVAEEPIARKLYESSHFVEVAPGGFYDNGKTGCSPDGRPHGGLIEIKSGIKSVHYNRIKRGCMDPTHRWQVAFNLKEARKTHPEIEWIDFISYCSTYPEGKKLWVCRQTVEDLKEDFAMIDARLAQFFELVEKTKEDIMRG